MDINITINAPDLAGAIQSLADAIVVAGYTPEQKNLNAVTIPAAQAGATLQPQAPITPPMQAYTLPPIQQPPQIPAAVPTATAPTYTMEQLAVAATQLMDTSGHNKQELTAMLNQFGVQALTQLSKEQYGNFATQLRAKGARI